MVVWTGKWEDYLKKSSTPRLYILVEDLSTLPCSITLPIPLMEEVFEAVLEYKGLPFQCSNCLALDHMEDKCRSKNGKRSKPSTKLRVQTYS